MVQLLEQRTLLTPTVVPFQWTAVEDMTGDGFTLDDRGVSGASVLISNHVLHTRVTTIVGRDFYQVVDTSEELPTLQLPLGPGSANYAVAESPAEEVLDFVVLDPRYPLDLTGRSVSTKTYESFDFDVQLPQEGGWGYAFGDAGDSTVGAIYVTRFNESGQFSYQVRFGNAHNFGSGDFFGVQGITHEIINENNVVVPLDLFYDVRVGFFRSPRVSGVLYNDHNGNGVKDIGDEPLANHSFFVGSNTPNAENVSRGFVTTNDDGEYTLYVPPNLTLENDQRLFLRDPFNSGGSSSDESQTSGLDPILTGNLSSQHLAGRDIGIFKKTTVSGQVYVDHNGNGRKDAEDEPRAGVRVFVDQNRDGVLTELDHPVEFENPVTTDANGRYEIVSSGGIVRAISPGNPASLFSITQGGSAGYSALSGVPLTGADFGVFQTATIEGFVFNDVNGNGKYEHPTDTRAGRVKLQLDIGNNGTIDDSYTVGDSGEYQFRAPFGAYRVLLAPATGQKQTAPASAVGHVGAVTQDSQRIQGLLFGVQRGKDVGITSATFDGTKFKVDFSASTVITTPFNIGFYQSDDGTFSASDRRFGQLLSVTPPDSGQGIAEFKIPSAYVHDKTKPFLLVVADPDGKIAELNETNNTLTATRIIDVSPLQVTGNFQYDRITDTFKATGTVEIGFKPDTVEPFFPLVTVNGDVRYDSKTISSVGVVAATVGAFSAPLFNGKWDLRIADQVSTALKPTAFNLTVAGLGFKFHSLKLVNPAGGLTLDSFIELTGKIAIPFTASEQTNFKPAEIEFTAENPLKLKSDGPSLAGRINLPPFKFELFGMEMETEALSLEYFHPRRAFRLQGKVTINKLLPGLIGDRVEKVTADFSDTNYLEVNHLGFAVVGSISVDKVVLVPRQYELHNLKFSFNTVNSEWRGEGELKFPLLPGNTTLLAGLGFRNSEINFISLGADHLNIPLPLAAPTGRFVVLQKVQLQLDNLADVDPHAAEFGATVGISDMVELVTPIVSPGGVFDLITGPLLRGDFTGKISENHLVGAADFTVMSKDFLNITGQGELDWKESYNSGSDKFTSWQRMAIKAKGTLKALKGAIEGKFDASYVSDLSTAAGTRSFTGTGEVTFKFTDAQKESLTANLPEWVAKRIVERSVVGKASVNIVEDGNAANDFIVVYGDVELPVIGRKTLGFRYSLDGNFQWLSNLVEIAGASTASPEAAMDSAGGSPGFAAMSVASGPTHEFTIGEGTQHLLLAASWQNDVGDVPLEVVTPDGTVIAEADFEAHQIAVLTDFSTSTSKAIGLSAPAAGTWTVRAASPEGLGDIVYEAAHESAVSMVAITSVTREDSTVTIDYSAADPDSDATVRFFYDTDGEGFDGAQFGSDVAETDSTGSTTWNITNMPAGTYHIYAMIDDGNNAPVFAYAETPVVIEALPTSISGVVFEDSDSSGVRDGGEQPLASWTVFLDANNNGVLDNPVSGNNVANANATERWAQSNDDGEYSFANVIAGAHTLAVVAQPGFAPTFTTDGEPLLVVVSDDNPQLEIDLGHDRVPPVITSIGPNVLIAGSVATPNLFTLTIYGSGFVDDPLNPVQIVEVSMPDNPAVFEGFTTIIDSPTQMRVLLPANQVMTARTAQIRIQHTDVGISNVVDLIISGSTLSISPLSANKAEGNSATRPFTFTITRNGNTTGTAAVDYSVLASGSNAATTADFNGIFPSGTVTFAAGQTSKIIAIDVSGDTNVEAAETFRVKLTNAVGSAIAAPNATGTIKNDDTSFTIAAASASKLEGDTGTTPFTFTVTRRGVTTGTGSVKFAVTGTGANPVLAADFGSVLPTGIVSFAANVTSMTVTIGIKGETLFESDETFAVTLNTPTGGVLADATSAAGTILNDDTAVVIAATVPIKAEGTGTVPTSFTFTVTRLGNLNVASSVKYTVTANGSGTAASAATDFVGGKFPTGSVTFAAGEAAKLTTIRVVADTALEGNEGFTVTLSAPTGATLGATSFATSTIRNDDASLSIAATAAVKNEGHSGTTRFTFTVTRTGDTSGSSRVNYVVSGAATNGTNAADFGGTLPSGTVEFAANETTKPITINVAGDAIGEANEGFVITLSNPTNAILGTAAAAGTINNDDTSFAIAAQNATSANKAEGNSGNTAFTFTVTRAGLTTATASVRFAVIGTVGANPAVIADFGTAFPSGLISFAANETSKIITINVKGDTAKELDEGFTVTLSSPSTGATIAVLSAQGTIRNDD